MNTIKYSIFKIIEWINNKEKNIYLFVGSDKFKEKINKLKKKDLSENEEDVHPNEKSSFQIDNH